jgi:hypothetical protein
VRKGRWRGVCPISRIVLVVVLVLALESTEEVEDEDEGGERLQWAVGRLDLSFVQQLQELSEVGGKHVLGQRPPPD